MYENQTQDAILQRLLGDVTSGVDTSEGSFTYDVLSPEAIELAQAYLQLGQVLVLAFAQTTNGQYLDYRAGEHGVIRLIATYAAGTVTVIGTIGTVIPAGTIFITNGGVQFATSADATIPSGGSVNISVTAVNAGAAGNVPAGTITTAQVAIVGVTGITNAAPTTGGTDTESDTALLARLLIKVQLPATSGNANDYKIWATSVAGVGDAKVFPLWNGNGTVKVCIIDSNKQPATSDVVTNVANYIETVRPVGATVTVESATGLNIDVAATLTLGTGYDSIAVTAAITSGITSYLASIAFQQNYVSYAKIGDIILQTDGVLDYTGLTVNSGTSNIPVTDEQVAITGTITMS